MVGRTSKSNKRRRNNSESPTTTTTTSTTATSNANANKAMVSMVADLPSPQSSEGLFPNLTTFALQECDDFSNDAFANDFDLFTTHGATNKSTTTSEIGIQRLNMDFDIDQFTMFSTDTSTITPITPITAKTTPPSFDSSSLTSNKSNGSQSSGFLEQDQLKEHFPHVDALSQLIRSLEAHVVNKEIAIDEVMRNNQACIAEITKIMALEKYKLCKSCPMLVSTAMELMLTLYENGISPEARNLPSTSCAFSPPQPVTHGLPNLQFGVFQLEPEERIAFGNRIMCKELQRYTQVIRTLSAERQSQGDDGSSFGRVHMRWMVELENRVETFITTLRI
jgi:hypothetical protein